MGKSTIKGNQIFCPVCATKREISPLRLPVFTIVALSGLWALLLGLSTGFYFSVSVGIWSGLSSAVLCFVILEVYYSVKFKRELVCPVCQFDPVLYRRSPEQAKKRCLDSLKMREELFLAKWQALKKTARV